MNRNLWKARLQWLFESTPTWLCIAVIVILVCGAVDHHNPYCLEANLRWAGLILQVAGVATVVAGIHQTRLLFGHESIAARLGAWRKRFPQGKKISLVTGTGGVSFRGSATMTGVHAQPGPDATVQEKIAALQRDINEIREQQAATDKRLQLIQTESTQAVNAERASREKEDALLRKLLEASVAGGLDISRMGAVWLVVGVVLSTASVELSKLSCLQ